MAVYDEDEDFAPAERDYGIYVESAKWAEKLWDEICARYRRAA
jgi:hypothetical protein